MDLDDDSDGPSDDEDYCGDFYARLSDGDWQNLLNQEIEKCE